MTAGSLADLIPSRGALTTEVPRQADDKKMSPLSAMTPFGAPAPTSMCINQNAAPARLFVAAERLATPDQRLAGLGVERFV